MSEAVLRWDYKRELLKQRDLHNKSDEAIRWQHEHERRHLAALGRKLDKAGETLSLVIEQLNSFAQELKIEAEKRGI